jgi:hypothetical protein
MTRRAPRTPASFANSLVSLRRACAVRGPGFTHSEHHYTPHHGQSVLAVRVVLPNTARMIGNRGKGRVRRKQRAVLEGAALGRTTQLTIS